MISKRKFDELGRLLKDRHNDSEAFENFEKLKNARSWLHKHKILHIAYKRIMYGLLRRHVYYMTGPLRVLPDFIIIGCQKCATTSLYDYMIQHPNISPATYKEIHFFDSNYNVGLNWYRSFFPTIFSKMFSKFKKEKFVTGEASPMYIFNSIVPSRMSKILPKVKLIAILRNPVDRAYSHYSMQLKNGYETLSFEESITNEEKRIGDEREKEANDENYVGINLRDFSYLSRGKYSEQLQTWLNYFPKDQFLIIKTEDLEENPTHVLSKIFKFLDLPPYEIHNPPKKNVGEYKTMNLSTRKALIEYFKPYNEKLNKLLNENFDWNK